MHRRELVEQAARHCTTRYPEKTIELEMGKIHASGLADITVASVQSINSRDRIDRYDPKNFKLILVDEAHHIVASTYLNILDHFGLQSESIPAIPALVGVSATLSRFDGIALGKAIKHIVYHKDYIDMIGEKWLSNVIFTTVKSKADLSMVKKSATGDFLTPSLAKAVNTDETNIITVRAWMAKASSRKSTIVFCVDLAHLNSLTNIFRQHGIDARYVTGDTPKKIRDERLQAFKDLKYPVLLNCGVFTEGTDIPNIDCVLLARPTKSRNLLVQMIGRGMRLHQGKQNCLVIDMVATLEDGIMTTPTLFGLDPDELVENSDSEDLKRLAERRKEERRRAMQQSDTPVGSQTISAAMNRKITFTDYESVDDLIGDTSGERHIRALSSHAWVQVGETRYVLMSGPSGSYLTLEKDNQEKDNQLWKVKYIVKIPSGAVKRSPYLRPREIAKSESFEGAIRSADTFAVKIFNTVFVSSRGPMAAWRNKEATQAQIDFLNKGKPPNDDKRYKMTDISKGRAGDMITKIKFGARGAFNQISIKKRQQDRNTKQMRDLRRREQVSVGPLTTS